MTTPPAPDGDRLPATNSGQDELVGHWTEQGSRPPMTDAEKAEARQLLLEHGNVKVADSLFPAPQQPPAQEREGAHQRMERRRAMIRSAQQQVAQMDPVTREQLRADHDAVNQRAAEIVARGQFLRPDPPSAQERSPDCPPRPHLKVDCTADDWDEHDPAMTPPSEADSAGEDGLGEVLTVLARIVASANTGAIDGDDGFIESYNVMPGPVHAAIPLLARHGIVATWDGALAASSGVQGEDGEARERLAAVLAPAIANYVEAFMSCADSVAEVRQIDYRYMADDFLESCEIPQQLLDAVRAAGGGR